MDITKKITCTHCGKIVGFHHIVSDTLNLISPHKFGIIKKIKNKEKSFYDRYSDSTNYYSILKTQFLCTKCNKKTTHEVVINIREC